MVENLNESLLRGEKIEIVLEKSNALMETSTTYASTSRAVRRQQQCRKYKMIAAAVGASLVSITPLV